MGKSERYVSRHRGWRGGKGTLAHQAACIIESMQAHPGRTLNHYEPIPADVRAIIVEKLGAAKKAEKTQPLDDEALANIATAIVEETIRRGGDYTGENKDMSKIFSRCGLDVERREGHLYWDVSGSKFGMPNAMAHDLADWIKSNVDNPADNATVRAMKKLLEEVTKLRDDAKRELKIQKESE